MRHRASCPGDPYYQPEQSVNTSESLTYEQLRVRASLFPYDYCTDLTAFCYGSVTDYVAWPCFRRMVASDVRPSLPVQVKNPGDAQGDGRKGGGMVLRASPPRQPLQDLPILAPTPPQKTHGKGEGKFGAAQGSSNPEFINEMPGGKATNEKIARHSQLRECQKRKPQYMQPESAKSQSLPRRWS